MHTGYEQIGIAVDQLYYKSGAVVSNGVFAGRERM